MTTTAGRIWASLNRRWYYRVIPAKLQGKHGLEIGGPSGLFSSRERHHLFPPIYDVVGSVDNCNFSSQTVWSSLDAGAPFEFKQGKLPGRQFVHDATQLDSIASGSYDFLLASHVLEHIANPLRALREWRRVLKTNGHFLILVPSKEFIFDHNRPYTTLEHMLQDFEAGTEESDLTHLDEVLALHDLDLDKPAGTPEEFRARSLENFRNRCLHQHVFSPEIFRALLAKAGFVTHYLRTDLRPNIIAFGRVR